MILEVYIKPISAEDSETYHTILQQFYNNEFQKKTRCLTYVLSLYFTTLSRFVIYFCIQVQNNDQGSRNSDSDPYVLKDPDLYDVRYSDVSVLYQRKDPTFQKKTDPDPTLHKKMDPT